jgi:hypothetical protein
LTVSGDSSPKNEKKRQIGGELIIPAAAVVFTLYYFWTIADSPWTAKVNAYLVGYALLAAIAVFVVMMAKELLAGRANLGFSNLLEPLNMLPKRAGFIALTLAYLLLMDLGGFTLSTFLFLFLSMMLLDSKKRWHLCGLLALLLAGVGYGAFIVFFQTRLPKGPVESLLSGFW